MVLCEVLFRVKCGVVWCGMLWCGVLWCGVVWYTIWCFAVWYDKGRRGGRGEMDRMFTELVISDLSVAVFAIAAGAVAVLVFAIQAAAEVNGTSFLL